MPEPDLRKLSLALEEIWHEGGPRAAMPLRRGAVLAAIRNPFAGRYVEDIQPFMEDLKPLGLMMRPGWSRLWAVILRWCKAMAKAS